jgi:hypothetical protein
MAAGWMRLNGPAGSGQDKLGAVGPAAAGTGLLVRARAPVQQSDGGGDVAPHDPVTACCWRLWPALGFAVWGSQSGSGCDVVRAWPVRDRAPGAGQVLGRGGVVVAPRYVWCQLRVAGSR